MFYILYQFVTYLLTVPHRTKCYVKDGRVTVIHSPALF
jgi:hypothetical protein